MLPILVLVVFVVWFVFLRKVEKPSTGGVKSKFKRRQLYMRNYDSTKALESLPKSRELVRGEMTGAPNSKFFLAAKAQLKRDYILIIDRSFSMKGARWCEAQAAVGHLAPHICRFDPDGASLYFFDHEVVRVQNVTDSASVDRAFAKFKPRGSTDLAGVLHAAFREHFHGKRGASTVLVITDGQPNNEADVAAVITAAANSLVRDEELSVTFIQIGEDRGARLFLQDLDDNLPEAKFDIVDTIPAGAAAAMPFNEIVANSLYD